MEIGHFSPPLFKDFIRFRWLSHIELYVEQLQALLSLHQEKPDYWARDVSRVFESIRRLVDGEHFLTPIEFIEDHSPGEALAHAQRLIEMYGKLLVHWFSLFRAARDISHSKRLLDARKFF